MHQALFAARLGTVLRVVGSVLALVAFFVPAYGPPPGSLWDGFILLVFQLPDTGVGFVSWCIGALLGLLVGIALLACLSVAARPPRQKLLRWHHNLVIVTLCFYVGGTIVCWYLIAFLVELSNGPLTTVVGAATFGAWLIPIGLLLTLLGDVLLPTPQPEKPESTTAAGEQPCQMPLRSPRVLQALVIIALLLTCPLATQGLLKAQVSGISLASTSLASISMVSADEGWAVGDHTDDLGKGEGRVYHYHAGQWNQETLPPGSGSLTSAWMLSASEGWAFGYTSTALQIFHYHQGIWMLDLAYAGAGPIFGMQMLSPDEGWAVGRGGLLLHFLHDSWTPATGPTSNDLFGLALVSQTEGWAVGFDTILHYHDGVWTMAPDPFPRDALESVSLLSPTQGWVVGLRGAILQLVDGQWQQVNADTSAARFEALNSVLMLSPKEGWAVGDGAIFHYQDGSWQAAVKLDASISLIHIAMVSLVEGWAVGYSDVTPEVGVIVHYSQGRWVQLPNLSS